jgi:putative ABC transport system substrate-binding protein
MRRREFIALVSGAFILLNTARAQQSKIARIGMLFGGAETDHQIQWRIAAFHKGLQELGWTAGRNIQIELRWGAGDPDRIHAYAAELVGLNLDLIFAANTPAVAALQKLTKTIPIVFASVGDPVDSGFVENLSRPGGNITGFANLDYTIGGKCLETLKTIAPNVQRVSILYNPETTPMRGKNYFRQIETEARRLRLQSNLPRPPYITRLRSRVQSVRSPPKGRAASSQCLISLSPFIEL